MRSILKTIKKRAKENLKFIKKYISGNAARTFVADQIDLDLETATWFEDVISEHDKLMVKELKQDKTIKQTTSGQLSGAYALKRDILYSYAERPWHIANGYDSKLGDEFRYGYIETFWQAMEDEQKKVKG